MNCNPDPRPLGEAVVHVVVLLQVQDQGQTSHVEMCVNILMFPSILNDFNTKVLSRYGGCEGVLVGDFMSIRLHVESVAVSKVDCWKWSPGAENAWN